MVQPIQNFQVEGKSLTYTKQHWESEKILFGETTL